MSQNKTWIRLKKNKAAIIGISIIFFFTFVALFAYLIAPDNTTNANTQIVEVGGKKPGFRQLFYKHTITGSSNQLINTLINGRADQSTWVPVQSYSFTKDSIYIKKYVDEGVTQDVAFAIKDSNDAKKQIKYKKFIAGTDKFGRDLFSRIIIGTRVSLSVGLIAVFISLSIGIVLGALAGYYKGWVDHLIMWLINVVWSIPTLLLVFAFSIALGKGFWQIFIAVGLTMWVNVARLVRGQVLKEREMQYVEAAKVMGFGSMRIIFKHILPNIMGPIIVIAAGNFASAIIIEAGLSFLGIGIQAPQPSWGLMVKENYNFIITNNPMLALAPGFAIMILVLAFYLVGNGLRDALNVRGKG